uniref:Uncharacterized protein n=1 Tax=viral metagenome TaxID=1070528 RepID=A0A6C0B2N9_9ZZZZ
MSIFNQSKKNREQIAAAAKDLLEHIRSYEKPAEPVPLPRCVVTVINRLLTIIPLSETSLRDELTKYKDPLWNQAPELLSGAQFWIPVGQILEKNITKFDEPWKTTVLNVFNGAE